MKMIHAAMRNEKIQHGVNNHAGNNDIKKSVKKVAFC